MKDKPLQFQLISKLAQWLLMVVFIFPALPLQVANGLFIAFVVVTVVNFFLIKSSGLFNVIKRNLLIAIPFIPYLIEYLTHPYNNVAGFELEKKLLFFAAPLVISLYMVCNRLKNIRVYMYVFTASLVALSLYCLVVFLYSHVLFSADSFDNGARILRNRFEEITHLHPTYYGLFTTTSILWLIYDYKNQTAGGKALYILFGIILFLQELLVAPRMPLVALVLCSYFIVYKIVPEKKKLAYAYAVLTILLFAIPFAIPSVRNRIYDAESIFKSEAKNPGQVNERRIIWDCDQVVFADNFWLGTGSRNAQLALNSCYAGRSFTKGEEVPFNSHNQFFTLGISYGIFIFSLFVLSISLFIKKLWGDWFAVSVMISAVLVMLTESILERQWGVYFYVLFFLLFYNKQMETNKE